MYYSVGLFCNAKRSNLNSPHSREIEPLAVADNQTFLGCTCLFHLFVSFCFPLALLSLSYLNVQDDIKKLIKYKKDTDIREIPGKNPAVIRSVKEDCPSLFFIFVFIIYFFYFLLSPPFFGVYFVSSTSA